MSDRLAAIQQAISERSLPPVHRWAPARCGRIDITIDSNGEWYYQGSRIERLRMVRLFASVLRREENGEFCLVTPAEKLTITVQDAPFTAVVLERHGTADAPILAFTTNLGEPVIADAEHRICVEYPKANGEPRPYVQVRDRLPALITRSVFIELAGYAVEHAGRYGVFSSGVFMALDER